MGPFALTTDGTVVAAALGGRENSVCVWDVATGRALGRWSTKTAHMNSLGFAPDGKALACVETDDASDKTVARLRVPLTGKVIRDLPANVDLWGPVAFAPDGRTLAAAGSAA